MPQILTASAPRLADGQPAGPARRPPSRWLPSVADILFCSLLCALAVGRRAVLLLDDADVGWHIRNGEHILATGSIPHRDYFSWTRAGQPWYAWEWLSDVIEGFLHHLGGLNAVVALSAVLIALTYWLLWRRALQRSGPHGLLAAGLTVLAILAASGHFLARPDQITVLLTIIWLQWLEEMADGKPRFWRFPLLMLLWTNLHGGFIVGLALVFLYAVASGWQDRQAQPGAGDAHSGTAHEVRFTSPQSWRRTYGRTARMGACFLLCSAATLVNPYGWQLHLHIFHYLSDHFLLDHIREFTSPDFHILIGHCFELLLLAGAWALYRHSRAWRPVDLLLATLAVYLGLAGVRNLGLASLILVFVLSGVLGRSAIPAPVHPKSGKQPGRSILRGVSARFAHIEAHPRFAWLPLLVIGLAAWIVLHQGRLGDHTILDAHFSRSTSPGELHYGFPGRAAGALQARGITSHVFTTDSWAGYLMYRLYPRFHPFFDGRSDFYGDALLREYLRVVGARPGWQAVLKSEQVEWVLVPPDLPLTAVLRESPKWRLVYQDRNSFLFQRSPAVDAEPAASAGSQGS